MSDQDAIESLWFTEQRFKEWNEGALFQRMRMSRATPMMMDALLADGWRHFGEEFFRDKYSVEGVRLQKIIPLRVDLSRYMPRRDQRRALKRAERLQVTVSPTRLTSEHHALFERHAERFERHRPSSLSQFFSEEPHCTPCPNMMCEVRDQERLLAVSFIDLGARSLSSVYAIFEPSEARLSLGNITLLMELRFAQMTGRQHLYTGYGHIGHSAYAYKKRFRGTEFYDWAGVWRPLEELDEDLLMNHPFEREDIPAELFISSPEKEAEE
jgi:arginine-tRNA-protein transferase